MFLRAGHAERFALVKVLSRMPPNPRASWRPACPCLRVQAKPSRVARQPPPVLVFCVFAMFLFYVVSNTNRNTKHKESQETFHPRKRPASFRVRASWLLGV